MLLIYDAFQEEKEEVLRTTQVALAVPQTQQLDLLQVIVVPLEINVHLKVEVVLAVDGRQRLRLAPKQQRHALIVVVYARQEQYILIVR